jgi:hypothetical protein
MSGNRWDMGYRPAGAQWYLLRLDDPFTGLNTVTRGGEFSGESLDAVVEKATWLAGGAWFGSKGFVDG